MTVTFNLPASLLDDLGDTGASPVPRFWSPARVVLVRDSKNRGHFVNSSS
jgi:hypothetical protein